MFFFQSFSRSPRKTKAASRRTAVFSVIQTTARTMMDAAVTEVSAIPAVAAEGAAIKRRLFLFH
ncbi:hypothetical protein SC09_contig4orf01330 [Bacillus subtilis]|uniref:Uncharacterized protein n=1 Tax=Bacillus subtilis TaxID=1423 RepID=A0A0D1IBH1_BACIU|nr:hypothetical protein SC09_contig4orf01330 [Bacillus subtilis]